MEGLYSLISHRGLYFENKNGYDGLAGATVQITKNFATLGDMLNDENAFEINQELVLHIYLDFEICYIQKPKIGFKQARKNATTEGYFLFGAIWRGY